MKQEINQVNNSFNTEEIFYTGVRPEDKKKSFSEVLMSIDEKAWYWGRKVNFLGLGTILPSDESWTDGDSEFKTVNFFKQIFSLGKNDSNEKDINSCSFISENDIKKGYIVDIQDENGKEKEDSIVMIKPLDFNNADEDEHIDGNLNFATGEYVFAQFDEAPCAFEPFDAKEE